MRLRTVMLVLALLFVPVMADAGDPREAEFSPPANEGVTIAAAAAGLAGWLYVANPGKRRRVEAVAGTMGHYFNHLPENRTSAAASAADGARVLLYVTARYWVFLRCYSTRPCTLQHVTGCYTQCFYNNTIPSALSFCDTPYLPCPV